MSDTRIVLVKPGDVLILGNVTLPEDDGRNVLADALHTLKETLGLAHDVLVFEDDIDLAVKPAAQTNHEVRWSPTERAMADVHSDLAARFVSRGDPT